ncbi:MAG: hypothetical protein ACTSW1_00685 [Candidatus Hodarchaeales archaeon]
MDHLSAPEQAKVGEEVTISGLVKNIGDGTYTFIVDIGIIPQAVAKDWGFLSLFPLSTFESFDCCPGQENIDDVRLTLEAGESETVSATVKVPYSGIEDKCYNNDYWDPVPPVGGKSYIVYMSVHNKCYAPGDTSRVTYDFETRYIYVTRW